MSLIQLASVPSLPTLSAPHVTMTPTEMTTLVILGVGLAVGVLLGLLFDRFMSPLERLMRYKGPLLFLVMPDSSIRVIGMKQSREHGWWVNEKVGISVPVRPESVVHFLGKPVAFAVVHSLGTVPVPAFEYATMFKRKFDRLRKLALLGRSQPGGKKDAVYPPAPRNENLRDYINRVREERDTVAKMIAIVDAINSGRLTDDQAAEQMVDEQGITDAEERLRVMGDMKALVASWKANYARLQQQLDALNSALHVELSTADATLRVNEKGEVEFIHVIDPAVLDTILPTGASLGDVARSIKEAQIGALYENQKLYSDARRIFMIALVMSAMVFIVALAIAHGGI